MLPLSANILTPLPASRASRTPAKNSRRRYVALPLILVSSLVCAASISAQTTHKKKKPTHPKSPACLEGCRPATSSPALDNATPEDAALQKELGQLARGAHLGSSSDSAKLAAFADKNISSVWGQRAALALGFDAYSKQQFPQAMQWLAKAKADPLLLPYTLFWTAQTEHALGRNQEAAHNFAEILKDNPDIAFKEQLLEAYVPVLLETGRPQDALDALATYPPAASKPALLLLRARAYEAGRRFVPAAKDYQALYYKFPLADESKDAQGAISRLNKQLRDEFPYATAEMQDGRAEIFYNAHKWKEARAEYEKLSKMFKDPANAMRQRALVRAAESRQHPKQDPRLLAGLKLTDPEADAERLYYLSQAMRSAKDETGMLTAIEDVVRKYPQSHYAEEALMSAGNYYWVELDRAKAAGYYQRLLDAYPGDKNAYNAEWRVAWVAYLQRLPYAGEKMTNFLRKYPTTGGAVNALYWLGRDAERSGNPAHARSYFRKAVDRFPTTYFAEAAEGHLEKLGPGDEDPPDFLAQLPAAPVLRPFDEPVAPNVLDRWNRAIALRTIAFDASAELELRAAYAATASPRFLIEAAQAAFDQGHFAAGMNYGRQAIPSFDSRKYSEVPPQIWKVLFPLPYELALRREAQHNNFDPMFAAGLIRQESTFQADIVSHANAIGLMQILPKTGRLLAKQKKLRYTKATLFDPDLNIELGTLYIANLINLTGAPEYAAAAYNAGEDRIALWKAERTYDEIPELVESIPFTETREYVQIVMRNAVMYRRLYPVSPTASQASSSQASATAAGTR